MKSSRILLAALLVSLSSPAFAAQPDADASALKGKGKDGSSVYVFDDDSIEGEILRPEGVNLNSRGKSAIASLITIRQMFISELIQLSNDI